MYTLLAKQFIKALKASGCVTLPISWNSDPLFKVRRLGALSISIFMRTSLHCFHWPETTMRAITLSVIFFLRHLKPVVSAYICRHTVNISVPASENENYLKWGTALLYTHFKGDCSILLSSKRWKLYKQHFGCIGAIKWIAREDLLYHSSPARCHIDNFSVVFEKNFLWDS